jgi:hypothetical protein
MSKRNVVRSAGVAVAASVLALSVLWWPEPLRAVTPSLYTDAVLPAQAAAQLTPAGERGIVRSRPIALDTTSLPDPGTRPQLAREPTLLLELFPDVAVAAVFDRFDPSPTGVTWVGHVEGQAGSAVTMVYGNGLMSASIITRSGTYQIRPATEAFRAANPQPRGEVHIVAEVDQSALPREAEPVVPEIPADALDAAVDQAATDTADVIDVMFVYTPTAEQHAGGPTGIANLMALSIADTNTTYINSGIAQRVRLVHTALVNYTEAGSFNINLNDLRLGVGGLSGVAALRDQFGADLVMMLIHPTSPSACGIGYLMSSISTAFAPFGYSVTDTNCMSPNLTVAHEFGHNMGAHHDWYVTTSTLPFTYAHGYANTDPGQRWRTVMSYNDKCAAQGFNCTRLLGWSNPDYQFNPFCTGGGFVCDNRLWHLPGRPMGIAGGTKSTCTLGSLTNNDCDADNRRTLNTTALTVANLRSAVVPLTPRQ